MSPTAYSIRAIPPWNLLIMANVADSPILPQALLSAASHTEYTSKNPTRLATLSSGPGRAMLCPDGMLTGAI